MNGDGRKIPESLLDGLIEVRTPDSVVFYHLMAGISVRGAACIVDMLIQVAALFFIVIVGGILSIFVEMLSSFWRWLGEFVPLVWIWAVILFLVWFILTGYFVVFETFWGGQTPGKRLLRIRVLKDSGGPIGFYEALLRNIMRFLDSLPTVYAVGIVTALLTQREQRLGDLVAGTIVVREPKSSPPDPALIEHEVSEEGKDFMPFLGLDRLDEEDFILVRDFLERRRQLAREHRGELAVTIATRVARKMVFIPPKRVSAECFLEAVVYQGMVGAEDRDTEGEWVAEKTESPETGPSQ
jgi:uncharacterized RDD family membrane protein YckC